MKIFDTTTALAAATLTAGQMVETKGRFTAGDGSGSKYYITTGTAGPYDVTLANGNIAVNQFSGNIRGSDTSKHFALGCIPRCTAGVFSLLDDAGHTPMNVTSVSQPDPYAIRVTYGKVASKINSFIATPDDALTPFGVVCGGDVGTQFANIITAAPFSAEIQKSGGTPSLLLNDLWAGGIAGGNISISASDASICRITHTPSVSNDPPVVSLREPNLGLYPVVSFYSDSIIDVMMTGDAAGYISYNGASWTQALSENLTAPTLTWTGSNTLQVQHGITGAANRTPIVSGHNGVYIVQVVNIGTDSFEVAFYDYTGTKITTQDTNMKFWYRMNLRVPCTWADNIDVVVRRGHVKVPSALYSGVAGNNFWVCGDMEPLE